MSKLNSPFVKLALGVVIGVAVLGVLRFRPWQPRDAAGPAGGAPRQELQVGFLPVT